MKRKKPSYIWVAYAKEPPYLPIAVADTAKELAAAIGLKRMSVIGCWSRYRRGKQKNTRYHRVKID